MLITFLILMNIAICIHFEEKISISLFLHNLLMSLIKNNVDILMISETKLDESFPDGQFTVKGYSKPFRLDRNKNGGGIMLYVREDIPARLISVEKSPIEAMFIEINLRNRKWLFCCS